MKQLRIITRVMVIDDDHRLLLVRNKDANFWYPPGGGWEYEEESIKDCVVREVAEETGYKVVADNVVWVREFREEGKDKVYFETFWKAHLADDNTQTADTLHDHIDLDVNGAVEEARWFTDEELATIKVLPKRITSISELESLSYDTFFE